MVATVVYYRRPVISRTLAKRPRMFRRIRDKWLAFNNTRFGWWFGLASEVYTVCRASVALVASIRKIVHGG
jgi:hypothetical protein